MTDESTNQPGETIEPAKTQQNELSFEQQALALAPIGDLCKSEEPLSFVIPDYQRGYRWTEAETKALLEDILEFAEAENKTENSLYCLQPLVMVKRRKDGNTLYEVIDGQQRLTTIRLILWRLKEFEGDLKEFPKLSCPYTLKYRTRKKSTSIIETLAEDPEASAEQDQDNSESNKGLEALGKQYEDNIDFHHMKQAVETIDAFLDPTKMERGIKSETQLKKFATTLLEKTQFIWYCPEELQEQEDGKEVDKSKVVDVFRRLNVGKIRLTDSELIKALLLTRKDDKQLDIWQQELALQWDAIEAALGDDEFWYFLTQQKPSPTRIDLIFELLEERDLLKTKGEGGDSEDNKLTAQSPYKSFLYVDNFLKVKTKENEERRNPQRVREVWKQVMELYLLLREWYSDVKFYHYVGFLLSKDAVKNAKDAVKSEKERRGQLRELIKQKGKDKSSFLEFLKGKIWESCTEKLKSSTCEGCSCKKGKPKQCVFLQGGDVAKRQLSRGKVQEEDFKWEYLEKAKCLNAEAVSEARVQKTLGEEVLKLLVGALISGTYENKTLCRPLLLLHNVQTVVIQNRREKSRYGKGVFYKFPFHLYNRMNWDVEHIDSATTNDLTNEKDQKAWLVNACLFLEAALGGKLEPQNGSIGLGKLRAAFLDVYKDKYKEGLKSDVDEKIFLQLMDEAWGTGKKTKDTDKDSKGEGSFDKSPLVQVLRELLKSNGCSETGLASSKNSLWNYALLDRSTNRSYQNAIFPIKRKTLIERERGEDMPEYAWKKNEGLVQLKKEGGETPSTFVPPCTMAAFLKKYSKTNVTPNQWTEQDAAAYLDDICKKLTDFLFTPYEDL